MRQARDALRDAHSRPGERRIYAVTLFAACATVIGVAMWLTPSTAGLGTHTQLGLGECGLLVVTGMPCATCGMTTAFSRAAHGQLLGAFAAQPAGAVLAIVTAVAMLISGYAACVGLPILPLMRRVWCGKVLTAAVALIVAAWAYKIYTI